MKRVAERFRKYDDEYIQLKKDQYTDVATRINDVIQRSGYGVDEGGFSLSKKWLLNNERMSLITALGEAGRTLMNDLSKWVPIFISFILGVLTSYFTNQEEFSIANLPWVLFLVIIFLGFCMEIGLKYASEKIEKLHIRILEEMTFSEYKVLIRGMEEKKEEDAGKDDAKKQESAEEKKDGFILYSDVEKTVNRKRKCGFTGYQNAVGYLKQFTQEQLNYIEVEAKARLELGKRMGSIDGLTTIFLSIIALFFSVFPDITNIQNDILNELAVVISIAAFVFSAWYLVGEFVMSKPIERHERILRLVEKIREN